MEAVEGFGPFLRQMRQEWTQGTEDIGRFIKNCDGNRAVAIKKGLPAGREYNVPWLFIASFCAFARYLFFFLSKSALRDYICNAFITNVALRVTFIAIGIVSIWFNIAFLLSYIESIGPIVDYHEIGRVGKIAMILISSCAALVFRLLVQDIYHSYILITLTAELQVYFQLLYYSRDHSFWDVFFVASLQIIIVNLKDGNIWVLASAVLLICKLLFEKFISYSIPISQEELEISVISS
ncbi:hypothetical protein GH714_037377 [Hevea brasiliensis]|uniref:Uncharacterized protein n=1 Tax=Hevea brasiliensis TaxID=3981 RepID=A0A6A6L7R5_HEVBR|nr:hypothetical protein GH714_037377 [Hevea brasiliensis]